MIKLCERCGTPFRITPSRARRRFCSQACVVEPVANRFWKFVNKSPNCWEWTGCRDEHGYGSLYVSSYRNERAHRFSWILHNGPVPDDLHVLHHCDNPPCIRPDHLFLGDRTTNAHDRHIKGRSRGGSLAGELNGNAGLTNAQAEDIRKDHRSSYVIARQYGIGKTTVNNIRSGRTWSGALSPSDGRATK